MVYYTADTYKNYERIGKPFDKNGKLYQTVKWECPRCNGRGIIISRIENGQLIPIPVDQGICYQCFGKKYLTKEVRLYTENEYFAMKQRNENIKKRNEAARRKEMEENFAKKKAEWLKSHGFNEDGVTYLVKGETYSIKDELKAEGYIFDPVLLWHRSTPLDELMEDNIPIKAEEVLEFSAWGEGHYLTGAKEKIKNLVNPLSASNSTWLKTEVGDHFKDLVVTFVKRNSFDGRFGVTNIYTFKTEDEKELVWFTATNQNIKLGDNIFLSGKVKEKKEFRGIKQTVVTRCHIS